MTWFDTTARENFEKHLLPLKDEPLRCLQLGVWEGDASEWIMENLPEADLIDVDTFKGSDETHPFTDMAEIRRRYEERMEPYGARVRTWIGTTFGFLCDSSDALEEIFDFVYIDADHHAAAVLRDAVMAWPLLASQGIMCFDDLTWQAPSRDPYEAPGLGIQAFVQVYGDQLRVMERNTQMWVEKL